MKLYAAVNYFTAMAHNSSYGMLANNMARMSLLRNCDNMDLKRLHQADTKLALDNLNNRLLYEISMRGLEKKRGFDTFA